LFIPDISGFTKFVNQTEVEHGKHVIAELLDVIIGADELGMTVSEIEGDAVFFYRRGALPGFDDLTRQARRTFEAFHRHLKAYESHLICGCGACAAAHGLSLKVVAHAGPIELLAVRGFEKPFGSDVIVAHRLLKNDLDHHEYLLVTRAALGGSGGELRAPEWSRVMDGRAVIDDVGDVDYHYVSLGSLKASLPDLPVPSPPPRVARPPVREIHIERPVADVYEVVSNLDLRRTWN
jgi:hypothetical protein